MKESLPLAQPGRDQSESMRLARYRWRMPRLSWKTKTAKVTLFTTDDKGHFQVSLSPGHYKVSLKGRKSSIGRFGPFEADVAPGKMRTFSGNAIAGYARSRRH